MVTITIFLREVSIMTSSIGFHWSGQSLEMVSVFRGENNCERARCNAAGHPDNPLVSSQFPFRPPNSILHLAFFIYWRRCCGRPNLDVNGGGDGEDGGRDGRGGGEGGEVGSERGS
jgi:hypothetical protein